MPVCPAQTRCKPSISVPLGQQPSPRAYTTPKPSADNELATRAGDSGGDWPRSTADAATPLQFRGCACKRENRQIRFPASRRSGRTQRRPATAHASHRCRSAGPIGQTTHRGCATAKPRSATHRPSDIMAATAQTMPARTMPPVGCIGHHGNVVWSLGHLHHQQQTGRRQPQPGQQTPPQPPSGSITQMGMVPMTSVGSTDPARSIASTSNRWYPDVLGTVGHSSRPPAAGGQRQDAGRTATASTTCQREHTAGG